MTRWVALVLLAAAVALAMRLPQLDRRPMHNDEAVNAIKFGELWERGTYRYDPTEYHGPVLHYATATLAWLTAAPDFDHLSETRLRLLTVLAGVALILVLPLVADGLGRRATVLTALFTALSPAMVFYSRYWIHEMLLVLFTFLTGAALWRWWKRPAWGWALLAGISLGLMHATKETFVLALVAAAGALGLNLLWARRGKFTWPELPWKQLLGGLAAWLLIGGVFFTSFFSNPVGLWDSVATYFHWLGHADGSAAHQQPVMFYFERLFWFRSAGGVFCSESLLLALAVVGLTEGFRAVPRTDCAPAFVRFITFYVIGLAAIYTAIPYKTPWCALGFLHGLILLAGVGGVVLWNLFAAKLARVAIAVALGLGAIHLGWQAWRASFPLCADRANPWVYAQTSVNLLELVQKVCAVSSAGQGEETLIKVITADGDCWPLPWYLRSFKHLGYWEEKPEDPFAPMMLCSASLNLQLDAAKTHVMVGYFQLRPQVFLEFYVERELWAKSLRR